LLSDVALEPRRWLEYGGGGGSRSGLFFRRNSGGCEDWIHGDTLEVGGVGGRGSAGESNRDLEGVVVLGTRTFAGGAA